MSSLEPNRTDTTCSNTRRATTYGNSCGAQARQLALTGGLLLLLAAACSGLISCLNSSVPASSSALSISVAPQPVFSSSAPTQAAEAQLYTYNIAATDPAGGTVTFSLADGPGNAAIAGSTLTWTPTHAQSRVSNTFTLRATTSEGGTATQTFSVVPSGNINGIVQTKFFYRDGTKIVPFDLSGAPVQIYVPGAAGYASQPGNSDGTFTIPNIPPGNFWLSVPSGNWIWTNQSDLTLTANAIGRSDATPTNVLRAYSMGLSIPSQAGDWMEWFSADALTDQLANWGDGPSSTWANSQLWSGGPSSLADTTKQDEVFLTHLQQGAVGSGNAYTIVEMYQPAWKCTSLRR
jgi:hypothetical protein